MHDQSSFPLASPRPRHSCAKPRPGIATCTAKMTSIRQDRFSIRRTISRFTKLFLRRNPSRVASVATRTKCRRAPSVRPGHGQRAGSPPHVSTTNSTNRHMCETRQQSRNASGRHPNKTPVRYGPVRADSQIIPAHRAASYHRSARRQGSMLGRSGPSPQTIEEEIMKLEGGCQCGAVRYVVEGEPMMNG